MFKLKKTLLISLILLIFPFFVLARPADPSRFPKYEPLLQLRPNEYPNVSGNVNSAREEAEISGTPDGQNQADSEQQVAPAEQSHEGFQEESGAGPGAKSRTARNWGIAISAVLVIGLGYAWKYKRTVK